MASVTSVQEVFAALPARYQAGPAAQNGGLQAAIQFELSGEGGGQYAVVFAGPVCTVETGVTPAPTLTFITSAADFLSLVNGDLNPMQAFMQGKVQLRGDVSLALKLQTLFA